MPGTLSTVTRVTARSISRKTYQAIALAKAVKAGKREKCKKKLGLDAEPGMLRISTDRRLLKWRRRLVDLNRGSLGLFNCHLGDSSRTLGTSTPARGSCHLTSALLNLSTALKLPSGWITVK